MLVTLTYVMINVSYLLSQTLVMTKVSGEYTMQQDTADELYTVPALVA